jgi:hypothetical protein
MPRKVQIAPKSGLKKECILLDNRAHGFRTEIKIEQTDYILLGAY